MQKRMPGDATPMVATSPGMACKKLTDGPTAGTPAPGSGLALADLEGRDSAALLGLGHLNLSEGALIAHDVLLEGGQQALGVLRGQDDAAAHLSLLQPGQHTGKIDDKLRRGVRDNSQVGILALGLVGGQFYLETLFLLIVLVHICLLFKG